MNCEFCDDYYDENRKHWWYHAESESIFLAKNSELFNKHNEPRDINAALCINVDDKINTRVVNTKHNEYDIYIGRGTKYGNPFRIGVDGNRKEVLEKFRNYLNENIQLQKDVMKLKGLILGCHCSPLDCHGDIIAEFIENRVIHDFQKVRHERYD